MCDTFVALGNSTIDGHVLFAKNSDREPNEAHEVVIIPRTQHLPESMVKCTYIEIPQVEETYQVLLAKPFWIWGAEMGANEFSVVIGNEAVFTKDPYGKEPGLLGMDLLRLALERSKTAYDALLTITDLLKQFGQSGNCGFSHPLFYHNSFLICDPEEAWVLETSGKEWAAEKVRDIRSISNGITIEDHWDLASENLVNHAIEMGWCKNRADFNFKKCYSDLIFTRFSDSQKRQYCTTQLLSASKGRIDTMTMIRILRNHRDGKGSPDKGISGADVCCHVGWGPIRCSQTTGSMVSKLDRTDTIHWVTASAAPCTSLFKPVWMDCGLPYTEESPTGKFDQKTLFWRHELIHRNILIDYPTRIKLIEAERDQFEKDAFQEVEKNLPSSQNKRKELSHHYFSTANRLEEKWLSRILSIKVNHSNRLLYKSAWKKFNQEANFN